MKAIALILGVLIVTVSPVALGSEADVSPKVLSFLGDVDGCWFDGLAIRLEKPPELVAETGGGYGRGGLGRQYFDETLETIRSRSRRPRPASTWKSPLLAGLGSLILPGAGHVYIERNSLGGLHGGLDFLVLGLAAICHYNRNICHQREGRQVDQGLIQYSPGYHYHPYKTLSYYFLALALVHRVECAIESIFLCRRSNRRRSLSSGIRVSPWVSPKLDGFGASLSCAF